MNSLELLESEAIYILRETVAQFQNPVLLFSGGKDSACLVHLAKKAFLPARFPFPLLHIDTGHNFNEALEFRDRTAKLAGARLIVRRVQETIDRGRAVEESSSRNALQAITLMDTIFELHLDALIGGARREEEKARAKERIFSVRNSRGKWNPGDQRPELWNLYNGKLSDGEHMRVFPLSNWTELDIWKYVKGEGIELPALYFAHRRRVVKKIGGVLLAESLSSNIAPGDEAAELLVRCRTVGDMSCTGLIESQARTIDEVIVELIAARTTERGLRLDDRVSESSMEDRKKNGYF